MPAAAPPSRPLIIQEDRSLLLEVDHPLHTEVRDFLAGFAELEQSLRHLYVYRLTRLSLWNAAASGQTAPAILDGLVRYSRYGLPPETARWIETVMGRYGQLVLRRAGDDLVLQAPSPALTARLARSKALQPYLAGPLDERSLLVRPGHRGLLKLRLRQLGYPPSDQAGYRPGTPLPLQLRAAGAGGPPFALRPYQQAAVDAFCRNGVHGGSGVVVLPCGAGKTLVGLAAMARLRCQTLILCPHTAAVQQWRRELLARTSLEQAQVGCYTGDSKEIAPVTLSTYQMLTYRPQVRDPHSGAEAPFPHFSLFGQRDWGLIIYDEVHLLPAPVFRATAELQACRRLGLTATLVREDGRQSDVFSLIGPKVYEAPWRRLEEQGWLARVHCHEVRVEMPEAQRLAYAQAASLHGRSRLAAENMAKDAVVRRLLQRHPGEGVLIIGRYLRQLRRLAQALDAPLVNGHTPSAERERLYAAFRRGEISPLVVSNVANFALDLPEASVALQVSGTYGSRQEETQRLGRLLRPKADRRPAHFYTLISQDTVEQEQAAKRQRFLIEQGYQYRILDAAEVEA